MKTVPYTRFINALEEKTGRKKIPSQATFDITYRCNHRCIYCYVRQQNKRKEISTKKVFYILDSLADAGCLQISFSGGEAFTRPDIFKILQYSKNKGFAINIMSNGSLIDDKTADFLKCILPCRIDITFLGSRQRTFDMITGIQGSFKRVMNGIERLTKRGLVVDIKYMLLKENIDEFFKVKKLFEGIGIRQIAASYVLYPAYNGNKSILRHRLSPKSIKDYMEKTKNSGITYDNIDRRDIFRNCAGGKTSCCINPYGELLLCSTLPVPRYNVLEQGFKDCWESLTGFVDGFKPGKGYKCPGCSLSAYCSFCPAMSFLETGYYDSCVLFKKQLAEINSSINSKNEDYIA